MRTLYVVCCVSLLACGTEMVYVYPDTGTTPGDQQVDHKVPPQQDTKPPLPDHGTDGLIIPTVDWGPPQPDIKPAQDKSVVPPPDKGVVPPPDKGVSLPDGPPITKCIVGSWSIGMACDDKNPCTYGDTCQPGPKCVGVAYTCLPSCTMQCSGKTTPTGTGECVPRSSVLPGYCYLDGTCFVKGALRPGQPCEWCDYTKSTTAWSYRPTQPLGSACTHSGQCTEGTTCHLGHCTCSCTLGAAVCQHTTSPTMVCLLSIGLGYFCRTYNP